MNIAVESQPGQQGVVSATSVEALSFPDITLSEFDQLDLHSKMLLLSRNRVINTDTYNRTMGYLAEAPVGASSTEPSRLDRIAGGSATFSLQMRRSPFGYIVVAGVREMLAELATPISEAEVRFAEEFYTRTQVPFFNRTLWREVVREGGSLPFEIHGADDGSVVVAGEPLLTVEGPRELVAHFEHVFHRVFYASMVATRAHAILQIIEDPSRFIEVGKRGAIDEYQHLLALVGARIGGGFTSTSNDAAVGLGEGFRDGGTIGHRYVQAFASEEHAFRHAIERLPAVSLLIDLIDSYKGIDLALALKDEYRHTDKKIAVRLDSGDILDQVRYFLAQTNEMGLTDPARDRLIVEGIDSLEELAEIEGMIRREFGDEARARVVYGAGGLLVSQQTSRADASTGFKLSRYTDPEGAAVDTMKFSSSPGKCSYPGATRVVVVNGKRFVAQVGERFVGEVSEVFSPLFYHGEVIPVASPLSELHERVERAYSLLTSQLSENESDVRTLRAAVSPETEEKIQQVRERYGLAS